MKSEEEVKSETNNEAAEKGNDPAQKENDSAQKENEKTAEKNSFDVAFNADEQSIQLVHADGTTEVLAARSASEPVKSPDSSKAAYVSPIEWEELEGVYM